MFICQIELAALRNEPTFYAVAQYGFDPGLALEDEIYITWEVWDKVYHLKAKVVERKKEVLVDGKDFWLAMPESKRKKLNAINPTGCQALDEGASLFLLRIFVEGEDREQIIEIRDTLLKKNPR